MKNISTPIKILALLFIVPIFCKIHPLSKYTIEFYNPMTIREYTYLQMILSMQTAKTKLFNDIERPFYSELPRGATKYESPMELFTHYIENFEFEVEKDKTELDNSNCQGVIGLGIENGKNRLMEAFKYYNQTERKVLFLDFLNLKTPSIKVDKDYLYADSEFFECKMASKSGLDDMFDKMWVCDFTHYYLPKTDSPQLNDLTLSETKEIKSRAAFDIQSFYITAPTSELEPIMDFFTTNDIICEKFEKGGFIYLVCNTDIDLHYMYPMYFLIGEYLFQIKTEYLFTNLESNKYTCLIRFMDDLNKQNVWVFGYPMFNNYEVKLDYDNKVIGFRGGVVKDMSDQFPKILDAKSSSLLWIILIVLLVLIVLAAVFFVVRNYCLKKKEKTLIGNEV